ncbi:uncharacterized protein LOC116992125 isoform X3 [Catharus ustulatus]|uniref:uncharacterized protein LOC116992125 isoform X3 n=1 Tax=Catharus ustulatus TaxID=91951 RepID=UPI00140E127C|nr:uncharacterized protein LOC116992125 isoform X3 [Catharus ustulatus]
MSQGFWRCQTYRANVSFPGKAFPSLFADEPSAAGELCSRLRRGNRARSDPRRMLSGLWGGCGGNTARLPSAAAPESSGSLGLSWCRISRQTIPSPATHAEYGEEGRHYLDEPIENIPI